MDGSSPVEHEVVKNTEESAALPSLPIVEKTPEYFQLVDEISNEMKTLINTIQDNTDLSTAIGLLSRIDSIDNLLSGTANLVTYVVKQKQAGTPIQTMVFLDKSARNGAYLFRTLWSELQKRNQLPDNIELPKIRFVDIGQDDESKYTNHFALSLLTNTLRQEDFVGRNVLVVDEYSSSGITLRKALDTIQEAYDTQATGIAQFTTSPHWYDNKSGILGVQDALPQYSQSRIVKIMNKANLLETEFLGNIFSRCSKPEFIDLISYLAQSAEEQRQPSDVIENYGSDHAQLTISKPELNALYRIIDLHRFHESDAEALWKYIQSAGGFMTSPLTQREEHTNLHGYRDALRRIIELYMKKRDQLNRQNDSDTLTFYGSSHD